MKNKDYEIVRVNIRVPDYIREWYRSQGDKYSVPYTNYMSMLLTQIYEKEKEKELFLEFNELMKGFETARGDVSANEMLDQFKEIMAKLNELEYKAD